MTEPRALDRTKNNDYDDDIFITGRDEYEYRLITIMIIIKYHKLPQPRPNHTQIFMDSIKIMKK